MGLTIFHIGVVILTVLLAIKTIIDHFDIIHFCVYLMLSMISLLIIGFVITKIRC